MKVLLITHCDSPKAECRVPDTVVCPFMSRSNAGNWYCNVAERTLVGGEIMGVINGRKPSWCPLKQGSITAIGVDPSPALQAEES